MSAEELQKIADGIAKDGFFYPWWFLLLAIATSALAAYLGSYFSRKAQDHAANENFDSLREQLRMTIGDAEKIKNELLSQSWYVQQHWSRREQHYLGLLESLTKMRIALEDCSNYFMEPDAENLELPDDPAFKASSDMAVASAREVRQRAGPAAIFLSDVAIKALEKMEFDHWHLVHFEGVSHADYYGTATELAEAAYEAVLVEAQASLKAQRTLSHSCSS